MVYGLKNFPRVFGWLLVYGLMVMIGGACCLLPGLYFAVAGCLIVPLVILLIWRRYRTPANGLLIGVAAGPIRTIVPDRS